MNPPDDWFAMRVFNYSILYLMMLFVFLLADHYLLPMPLHGAGIGLQLISG
jgi:protoheme IX farnesyltransferase